MVFINKIGSILKLTASKHVNLELSASNPSIYQVIRSMSSSKLFIGGLSYTANETSLREAFSPYGDVIEAKVVMDRETGRSRGFGFVGYTSNEAASSAIQAMDGKELHGRWIRVNYAADRPSGFRTGGYGSGSSVGYEGSERYGGNGGANYGGGGGYGSRDNANYSSSGNFGIYGHEGDHGNYGLNSNNGSVDVNYGGAVNSCDGGAD